LPAFEAWLQIRLRRLDEGTWRNIAFQGGDWLLYGFLTPFVFALGRRFPLRRPGLARSLRCNIAGSILPCARAWPAAGSPPLSLGLGQSEDGLGREFAGWFFTSLPFGVADLLRVSRAAHACSI